MRRSPQPTEPDRPATRRAPRARLSSVRLLVLALALQLLLGALLIWGVATGFSFLRGLFSDAPAHRSSPRPAGWLRDPAGGRTPRTTALLRVRAASGSPVGGLYTQRR